MATKLKTLAAPKNPGGRPSTFSQAIVDEVCARVAEGDPLAQVCREISLPLPTWYDWARDKPDVAIAIARAREAGFDMIAAQALRISDTPVEAIIEKSTANGIEITRQDALGHRKLQIETRLKLLAKWDPKRYGDRLAVGGADDMPAIRTDSTVTLEPGEAYKRLLGIK